MSPETLLAVAVLGANAVNDLLYRKASVGADRKHIYAFYLSAAGASAIIALGLGGISREGWPIAGNMQGMLTSLFYGILAGVLSCTAYLFFLLSFTGRNTAVTATIYRMNMVPGILLAILFLGETPGIGRIIAILLCVAGILYFCGPLKGKAQPLVPTTPAVCDEESTMTAEAAKAAKTAKTGILYSVAAFLSAGVLNFILKLAAVAGVPSFHLLFWRFFTVAAIVLVIMIIRRMPLSAGRHTGLAILSGLVLMTGVWCMLRAFRTGDVSALLPITQMSFIPVALFSRILLKEPLSRRIIPGMAAAMLILWLAG